MAANQAELHKLGRIGEQLARTVCKGKRTSHNHPFDYTDHINKVAYEVKTITGDSKDLKIHISEKSYKRKLAYAEKHNLDTVLVVLVVNSHTVDIYKGQLSKSIRLHQLTKCTTKRKYIYKNLKGGKSNG